MRRSILLLAGIALGAIPAGPLMAQGWTLDFHAGRATFEAAPADASSSNAALGFRFSRDHRFFQVSVAGPLASDNLFWGVVGAGDRVAHRQGRFEVGLDLTGQAHFQRDPLADVSGRGFRGDLFPMASVSLGPVVLEGRTGGSFYSAALDGQSWSRELWTSDLKATVVPAAPWRISGETRHTRNADEAYTFVGASAQGVVDRLSLWGSVGQWVSGLPQEMDATAWGIGLGISVLPRITAWTSVRRDPFDPVYLSTSRTSWGVGVSYRLSSPRAGAPPAGPEVRDRGTVILRLPLSEASSPPYIAGDFTGWEPVAMYRHGGHWRFEVELTSGAYNYAFRTADGEWFVPETIPSRRDDGMGGWVAVLIVP